MIERHPITSREQWLEMRKSDVTASVIGALFGEHPYVTARELYMAHSGLEFSKEENQAMRRGRLMEPTVAAAVEEQRPDWGLEKNEHYYRDPEIRLGATPDYLIHGDPRGLGVLQIKTTEASVYARDWDNGKHIPLYIELQTMVECMLTGADFGEVAVMVTPTRRLMPTILPIQRILGAERKIISAVKQFWDDVAAGREPALNFEKDLALLKRMFPQATEKTVDLSGDNAVPMLLIQRHNLTQAIKELQKDKDAISAELIAKIGEAERATGIPGWSMTYKMIKETTKVYRAHRELRQHRKDEHE